MSLRIGLKILNEREYLNVVLRQFYSHVDSIVCIEGCDSYMRRWTNRVTDRGLSTDGTTEIIQNFPDPRGIIEYVPMGFYQEEDESIQRMIEGLEAGDILWTASPDELFFDADIVAVKEFFDASDCLTMTFDFRTYWHDFYHRLRGGGWDNRLARVFRLAEDDMQIISKGATLQDRSGRTYNDAFYAGTRVDSNIQDHHMSYVRTAEKIMEKICWQLEIENEWSSAGPDTPVRVGLGGSLDCWALRQKYRTPQNYVSRTFPWFTCEYDERFDIYVESYEGPWPESLDGHPYFDLRWDDEPIIWRG